MRVKKTGRGFALVEFEDRNGVKCSLQKSSLATEHAVWLGCDDANPQQLIPGKGWQSVLMPTEYIANTRMHLNRKQVARLLPHLEKFVKEGKI